MSFVQRIEKLNRYIRGWMNYFGISQFWKPVEHIDDWLRRPETQAFALLPDYLA